jgi:L-aspartate oxidase
MSTKIDVLIAGCGIGGATAALKLAKDRQREILLVTRASNPCECSTRYAQGGIVTRGPNDTPEKLVQDILAAGAGAGLETAARILADEGSRLVDEVLIEEAGVAFDREEGGALSYTQEGGHSARRILHVGDATGRAIEETLLARIAELPNVTVRGGATTVDLITTSHHVREPVARYEPTRCLGAYVLNQEDGRVETVLARATVLATGGLGRIYRHTTNPPGARGDGVAMASRAGARIVNAEYIQFHPTTLASPKAHNFLISEAVRGEGARLLTPDGRNFMTEYAPQWGDLAPRDVVARAIHQEMVTHGYPHVLLDLTGTMRPDFVRERFPTIYARCLEVGLDITREPIPVVPAAHYSCGGVLVDEWGKTSIEDLYAVGEVSCTGVHGANRLASTSLLEGLVWGHRAAEHIAKTHKRARNAHYEVPPWMSAEHNTVPDPVLMIRDVHTVQDIMWLYVGLARSTPRLARALRELNHLLEDIDEFYRANRLTDELIGLRNITQTARIVAHAAWSNRRSLGTHYRVDAQDDGVASLEDAIGSIGGGRNEF